MATLRLGEANGFSYVKSFVPADVKYREDPITPASSASQCSLIDAIRIGNQRFLSLAPSKMSLFSPSPLSLPPSLTDTCLSFCAVKF